MQVSEQWFNTVASEDRKRLCDLRHVQMMKEEQDRADNREKGEREEALLLHQRQHETCRDVDRAQHLLAHRYEPLATLHQWLEMEEKGRRRATHRGTSPYQGSVRRQAWPKVVSCYTVSGCFVVDAFSYGLSAATVQLTVLRTVPNIDWLDLNYSHSLKAMIRMGALCVYLTWSAIHIRFKRARAPAAVNPICLQITACSAAAIQDRLSIIQRSRSILVPELNSGSMLRDIDTMVRLSLNHACKIRNPVLRIILRNINSQTLQLHTELFNARRTAGCVNTSLFQESEEDIRRGWGGDWLNTMYVDQGITKSVHNGPFLTSYAMQREGAQQQTHIRITARALVESLEILGVVDQGQHSLIGSLQVRRRSRGSMFRGGNNFRSRHYQPISRPLTYGSFTSMDTGPYLIIAEIQFQNKHVN
ncbi:unnamed protein product [Fusarium fujikuroi]|uniref:Uncharacterized protein n=1 Tax=Fusarium fujikuroi TaxID=5127 RepID=A0A9Q9RJ41_FUSFU|nr:unnamed protein product [Fusarium fujikuroi]